MSKSPAVISRIARLHGAASLLMAVAQESGPQHLDGKLEGKLELLAAVVEEEASALCHGLDLMGVIERPCPAAGPLANAGGANE